MFYQRCFAFVALGLPVLLQRISRRSVQHTICSVTFGKRKCVRNKAKRANLKTELNKKTKHAKFSGKRTFLTPCYAQVPVRIRG